MRDSGITRLLRGYAVLALVAAAVFSRLPLSFVPLFLLAGYFFLWLWPIRPSLKLFADYFLFFALTVLYSLVIGPWFAVLPSLPVIALLNRDLQEAAKVQYYHETKNSLIPTRAGIALPLAASLALVVSLLLGDMSILLASSVSLLYLAVMGVMLLRRMPLYPVECVQVQCRMTAGSEDWIRLDITGNTKIGGVLFLLSPYDWLKINPGVLFLKAAKLDVKAHISPRLAGPAAIKLNGYATDRWGLIQVRFSLEPVLLYVIPRARYAEWLARKYLGETKAGPVILSSSLLAAGTVYGLRKGMEYFGNRPYQPGDSLRNVDWKSSIKHRELISKEFVEFHGQSVITLINLAVGDEEEADKLSFWIIVTALTLAQENVPAVLATYDHEKVRVVSPLMHGRRLVVHSLEIAKGMVSYISPVKYLNPPDVARLRADIGRLSLAESEASRKLAALLQMELDNYCRDSAGNPATAALLAAFSKSDSGSNILTISHRNHDAIALAVNTANYSRRGNAVIPLYIHEKKHRREEPVKA